MTQGREEQRHRRDAVAEEQRRRFVELHAEAAKALYKDALTANPGILGENYAIFASLEKRAR